MQTFQIEVNDTIADKVLWFLENYKLCPILIIKPNRRFGKAKCLGQTPKTISVASILSLIVLYKGGCNLCC